jgi:CubicO group peptidase (beta-lactamase class C family)
MKNIILVLILLSKTVVSFSQNDSFIAHEGITNPLHKAHIGKVSFLSSPILLSETKETDMIKSTVLNEKSNIYMRVFMGNSLMNYLHPLAPELTAQELDKIGNFQFSFMVDSQVVYTENLHYGAFGLENKNMRTVFRVPLVSEQKEDSWGLFLWRRFMLNGGEDALTAGSHTLTITVKYYINKTVLKIGETIAIGSLTVVVPEKEVPEKQMAVQAIANHKDWATAKVQANESKIRELNKKIAQNYFKNITSIVVIKQDSLFLEEYFGEANRKTLHDTRSVGKTFTSALLGIAIKEGIIKHEHQPLKDFYDFKMFENYSEKKENITLKNLLTMTSGFEGDDNKPTSKGNEELMYPTQNWVKFALDLPIDNTKIEGKDWQYFTAGVVVLGDILHQKVPKGLEKYAATNLFKPLGITNYEWQYTPQKVVNTAGGLRLNSLDLAKFGQLYKNKGQWKGKEILTTEWVNSSLSSEQSTEFGEKYGYLWWNKTYLVAGKSYEVFYCTGNGGGKIFVFKDYPLVVVITATAYNQPYAHKQIDKLMENYLIAAITTTP